MACMNLAEQLKDSSATAVQSCSPIEAGWDAFPHDWETLYLPLDFDLWNIQPASGLEFSQLDDNTFLTPPYTMSQSYQTFTSETDTPWSNPGQSLLQCRQFASSTPPASFYKDISLKSPLSMSSIMSTSTSPEANTAGFPSASLSISQYTCNYCNKSFEKKHLLNCHERLHTKPIFCPEPNCTHRVAKGRDMKRHLMAQHPGLALTLPLLAASNFNCSVTGCRFSQVGFKRKDHLKRHVRKVHGK